MKSDETKLCRRIDAVILTALAENQRNITTKSPQQQKTIMCDLYKIIYNE